MTRRARTGIAVVVLVLSWGPAAASVLLAWIAGLPEQPVPGVFLSMAPPVVSSRFDDIGVTVAAIYGALAAVLIVRRPHPVAVVAAVHAVGSGIAAFGVQWGLLAEVSPGLPLAGLLAHAGGWAFVPGTFATAVVPILVLGYRGTGARILVAVGVLVAFAATVVAMINQAPGVAANPLAVPDPTLQAVLPVAYEVLGIAGVTVSAIVAVVILVTIPRRPADGPRLRWLAAGHVFLTVAYGLLVIPPGVPVPPAVLVAGMVVPVLGQMFYPAAVLLMVLGDRVSGIDATVSRVLSAALLAVFAAGGYFGLVEVLRGPVGWPDEAAGVVAVALVALGLQPVRRLLRQPVERVVYPAGDDPDRLVRSLGERIGVESGNGGLQSLGDGLGEALRIGSVGLRPADEPAADGAAWLPLLAGNRVVGTLDVPATDGRRLSRATRSRLTELAPALALAVQLASAHARLATARDAVGEARRRERRGLRRELHDGIGPALAGLGFGAAAAATMVSRDGPGAASLVDRLIVDLRTRLGGIRELERDLSGTVDVEAGLRSLAADFAGAVGRIDLEVDAADDVAPASRAALMRIAAEALHNAVRHANATRILIALAPVDARVELRIADDGRGLDPGAWDGVGVGMASMREQAAEAGAAFSLISSPTSGTEVRVAFPAERGAE